MRRLALLALAVAIVCGFALIARAQTFAPPTTPLPRDKGANLAVVALWGLAGLLLAIRFFRWTPRSG